MSFYLHSLRVTTAQFFNDCRKVCNQGNINALKLFTITSTDGHYMEIYIYAVFFCSLPFIWQLYLCCIQTKKGRNSQIWSQIQSSLLRNKDYKFTVAMANWLHQVNDVQKLLFFSNWNPTDLWEVFLDSLIMHLVPVHTAKAFRQHFKKKSKEIHFILHLQN